MPLAGVKRYLQERRKAVAAGILLAGCASGLALYLTASSPDDDPLADERDESKQYLREIEVYGGTANVVASEIREWFEGLWHGRALGITVSCLSALLGLAVFVGLTPLPPRDDASSRARGRREDAGS